MPRRLTLEEAQAQVDAKFPDKGLILTSFEGVNRPVSFICPEHGEQTLSFFHSMLKTKHGCTACSYPLRAERLREQAEKSLAETQKNFSQQALTVTGDHNQAVSGNNNQAPVPTPNTSDLKLKLQAFERQYEALRNHLQVIEYVKEVDKVVVEFALKGLDREMEVLMGWED
ncbi:DUF723 domain-containing protein [Neisseria animalis]|uniref:DUF723 domain-containing protein n=1 Tax=Neisseria animalis TaxID=492 RepID=A0A5P3MTD4_NEIAN|nr:DUF723 domain-containing protein [Neisseria animalis]QEY24863.1 DUF723 domain-containing protein [Neisseria animalis]ROW32393.1 DUF723 domain-containing protein [Neisseria animalis]VEE08037.1 DNA-binding protein [Neisseria animalis]